MDIIDINAMLGPWPSAIRYQNPGELFVYLDDYRITSAVTWHSGAQQIPWQYNAEISQQAAASEGRIRACHILDPLLNEKCEPGEGSLYERLRRVRPEAVRLLPVSQKYPLQSFYCGEILETLNRLHLPLLLPASEIPSLAELPALAAEFPDLPIIVLRMPLNHSRHIVPLLNKLNNVYIDMEIVIDTGLLEELVEDHNGSKKLLFGSDLPHHVPAGALGMVLYSPLAANHKENILHANWERLQREVRYDHT